MAVQGVGNVGYCIVKHLSEGGAKVYITDVFKEKIDRVVEDFGVLPVLPEEI